MTWLFDLDNTLYPLSSGLYECINLRMNDYLKELLQISYQEVDWIRKKFIQEYGTTLLGMMIHYQVDPLKFLTKVHSIQISDFLYPVPLLKVFLQELPGEKYIFTNSPLFYAKNVLKTLAIETCFQSIFDIESFQYRGKPAKEAFETVINQIGCKIANFVDDDERNIEMAKNFGFKCFYIDSTKKGVVDYYQDLLIPALKGQFG